MKIEQITALKDAGFTAEQIVALAPILTEEKPVQEPEMVQEPEQELVQAEDVAQHQSYLPI